MYHSDKRKRNLARLTLKFGYWVIAVAANNQGRGEALCFYAVMAVSKHESWEMQILTKSMPLILTKNEITSFFV